MRCVTTASRLFCWKWKRLIIIPIYVIHCCVMRLVQRANGGGCGNTRSRNTGNRRSGGVRNAPPSMRNGARRHVWTFMLSDMIRQTPGRIRNCSGGWRTINMSVCGSPERQGCANHVSFSITRGRLCITRVCNTGAPWIC